MMLTLLFPDLIGREKDHINVTVLSPGLLLQGQEGYQTSISNNAVLLHLQRQNSFSLQI